MELVTQLGFPQKKKETKLYSVCEEQQRRKTNIKTE
jgi:hypothetical protein